MRLPQESSSSWVHLAFATFAWASLLAWAEFPDLKASERDELKKLAGALRAHIDVLLKEARDTQDAQLFGRPVARAKQNTALVLLKRRVDEALALISVRLAGGAKQAPVLATFLPGLLTGFARAKLDERPKRAAAAASRLATFDAFTERDELVEKLNDAAKRAHDALEANDDAQTGWSNERSEEVMAKGKLRLELERVHRSLGALFPGQREFVESFFLKGDKPSEGTGEDETNGSDET